MEVEIFTPQRLAHLPAVMDVLRRTGALDVIDHAVREDRRSKVSTSECVAVIMCGVFLGHHDLWRMADRLGPYDMATLMRDPGFVLSEFTEERLARALDTLFDIGLERLMSGIALQAIEQFRLGTDFLHFDTTSLSFYGAYESEDFGATTEGSGQPPVVTFGYSKDHRPDLKQVLFGSLVTRDGGVPLYGKALNGNRSDSESAAEFFQQVRHLVEDPCKVCCVSDSKGWCAPVLAVVQTEGLRLLSRLPRHHRLHREVMAKPEGGRRVERPMRKGLEEAEYYEITGFDVEESLFVDRKEGSDQTRREKLLIPARAVRVFSSALHKKKMATLERTRTTEAKEAKRRIADWQALAYVCRDDAERAAQRHETEAGFVTLDVEARAIRVDGPFRRGRGRPRKHAEPGLDAESHYRVTYTTRPADEAAIGARLRTAATFVQIRTRNKGWDIADEEMIDHYRDQYLCEHGFSWLKTGAGPKGINPIYLETPKRIAALCFLYVLGLMIHNLIQRTVRANLKKWKNGLPYHRNKPSDRITTRFYFELFAKVQSVTYRLGSQEPRKQVLGVDSIVSLAAKALGMKSDALSPAMENRA